MVKTRNMFDSATVSAKNLNFTGITGSLIADFKH